jgi:hypothetical protein
LTDCVAAGHARASALPSADAASLASAPRTVSPRPKRSNGTRTASRVSCDRVSIALIDGEVRAGHCMASKSTDTSDSADLNGLSERKLLSAHLLEQDPIMEASS